MSDNLENRVRRIEKELGIQPSAELPEVKGYQMVQKWEPGLAGAVYVDEDGDVWFDTEDGITTNKLCLGDYVDEFIAALKEAERHE